MNINQYSKTETRIGILALLIVAFFYAVLVIPTKNLPQVNSLFLVWSGFSITAILSGIIAFYKNPQFLKSILKNDYKLATGLGIMHVSSSVCLNSAIKLTDISVVGLLLYTAPIWVFSFCLINKKIELNLKNSSIIILSIISTLLIMNIQEFNFELGVILGLLSGFFYSFDFIWGEKLQEKYTGIEVVAFIHMVGSIILIPTIWITPDFSLFQFVDYFWLFSFGGLLTLSFILFMYGVKRVSAFYSSIITLLEPVLMGLIGLFLYSEKPEPNVLIGGAIILLCIYLVQKQD
jgi:drug/metabolite transporter (DMT)-like permease